MSHILSPTTLTVHDGIDFEDPALNERRTCTFADAAEVAYNVEFCTIHPDYCASFYIDGARVYPVFASRDVIGFTHASPSEEFYDSVHANG
jgi:hypothetical protein